MGKSYCKYPGCIHQMSYDPCKMHRFPVNEAKRRRWQKNCELDGNPRDIPTHTFVCSCHFVGGLGPSKEHPDPLPVQDKSSVGPEDLAVGMTSAINYKIYSTADLLPKFHIHVVQEELEENVDKSDREITKGAFRESLPWEGLINRPEFKVPTEKSETAKEFAARRTMETAEMREVNLKQLKRQHSAPVNCALEMPVEKKSLLMNNQRDSTELQRKVDELERKLESVLRETENLKEELSVTQTRLLAAEAKIYAAQRERDVTVGKVAIASGPDFRGTRPPSWPVEKNTIQQGSLSPVTSLSPFQPTGLGPKSK